MINLKYLYSYTACDIPSLPTNNFNVEIETAALEKMAVKSRAIRTNVMEYTLRGKKQIYLLGEGRLINLAAAEGHPASVMDMSFANQALGAEYLLKQGDRLESKVYPVPSKIDDSIAVSGACLRHHG